VAPVQFYDSFASRDDLLERLYDEVAASTLAAVVAAIAASPAELRARVGAGVTAFCDSLLDDPRRARILSVEVVGVSGAIEVRRRQALRAFAELLVSEFLALEADTTDRHRATATACRSWRWPWWEGQRGGGRLAAPGRRPSEGGPDPRPHGSGGGQRRPPRRGRPMTAERPAPGRPAPGGTPCS